MATISRDKDTATVTPDGDILASIVPELREQFKQLAKDGVKHLIIDFKNVSLIESVGLGLLIATRNSLDPAGGSVRLSHVGPEIKNLLTTMRLNTYFGME